ncbi:uncharacterized protein LOC123310276 [Coccinella septempunctata]|uniref:uncharacterized protein LOC123310276 n=1 Tax=Coccinella septempunctata TaxID=41139 RepID=UPI001D07D80D|nr:uncharacterized protein LOC123310276 [Coccinella septempunctata]
MRPSSRPKSSYSHDAASNVASSKLISLYRPLITPVISYNARLLIESGSELSFISEDFSRQLSLPRSQSKVTIVGIGGAASRSRGSVLITLKSLHNHITVNINAHILSSPFTNLPSFNCCTQPRLPHLDNLKLADPEFYTARPIDIILGADVYGSIILPQLRKGPDGSTPTAQLSIFGWLVLGPICPHQEVCSSVSPQYHATQESDLQSLLEKFWEQEEVKTTSVSHLTADEQECEDHFKTTHSRLPSGRYMTTCLPMPPRTISQVRGKPRILPALHGLPH